MKQLMVTVANMIKTVDNIMHVCNVIVKWWVVSYLWTNYTKVQVPRFPIPTGTIGLESDEQMLPWNSDEQDAEGNVLGN